MAEITSCDRCKQWRNTSGLKSRPCQYGDAEMLQPLLDQIDEPIASVTADGAYDTVVVMMRFLKHKM